MNTFHQDVWEMEMAQLQKTSWDDWIARVERMVGHDLDGDEEKDGYSLDGCHDMFKAGKSPLDAFHSITWRKRGLHKA